MLSVSFSLGGVGRGAGEDDLSQKYLGRARDMAAELEEPSDPSIMSLWLGGVTAASGITEHELRDVFYSYGELRAVRLVRQSDCAFVEVRQRRRHGAEGLPPFQTQ